MERPILLSTAMVQSYQSRLKGQTRRTTALDEVNLRPGAWGAPMMSLQQVGDGPWHVAATFQGKRRGAAKYGPSGRVVTVKCPYGMIGDILWIREACAKAYFAWVYKADWERKDVKWRPAIHCPREASRYSLEITDIRLERLNDISEEDCFAEGCPRDVDAEPRDVYRKVWEHINGPNSWVKNPWVWVVSFPTLSANE